MAIFALRSSKGEGSLSSLASKKGWNGEVAREIDADKFYNTAGDKNEIESADVVSSVIEIVTKVAKMKIELKKDGKRETNKIVSLLNEKPNRWQSAYNFKINVLTESILKGNAYIEIVRGEDGEVDSLRKLDFDRVTVLEYTSTEGDEYIADIEYYVAVTKEGHLSSTSGDEKIDRYVKDGKGRIIDNENMIHLKPFNLGGVIGVSLLDYLKEDIEVGDNSKKFLKHFIQTGGSLGGQLDIDSNGNMMPEDAKQIILNNFNKTNSNYTGMVVTDSKVKYIPRQISDKVITSLLENKTSATRFAQMFQLPLHKMGISTSNMSLAQLNQDFKRNTLGIYTQMMESEFNDKFYRNKGDYDSTLKFDIDSIENLEVEVKERIAEIGSKHGAISINELRAILGFDKKDDPNLDKHRVSLNYVEVGVANDYQLGGGSKQTVDIGGEEVDE